MLDDVERRRLDEIEAGLTASDPSLARMLSTFRRWWPYPGWTAVLAAVAAVAAATLSGALAGGPPAAFVAGLTVAAVLSYFRPQRYPTPRRRPRRS